MKDGITLSFDFIDEYVRFTKPEYIQVFLYIKAAAARSKALPPAEDIAKALDISPVKAEFILEYWASRGEIKFENGTYKFAEKKSSDNNSKSSSASKPKPAAPVQALPKSQHIRSTRPAYSQKEINTAAKEDKQISGMFYQAETILKKALSPSETELLFSFHDWLGLPVEVILMLLSYAAKKGKTTKRYLETVAIDWADKGIDNFEAAEAYVSELEATDSAENKVRSILGIYNRGLSSTERKYIKLWVNELKIPTELISLAYDRTVEYTGKLSWSYMDKLLQSWIANGCTTVDDVKAADEKFYKANGGAYVKINQKDSGKKAKNKFNNYEDGNMEKYADLEEQLLDMMLDNDD